MVVIRNCFIFCLLFFFSSFGQTLSSDSNAVSLTSQSLIEKKIDFVWLGGTLTHALDQLHQKHGFKFSHAGQQISFVQLKPQSFKEAPLGYVLNELLKSTTFDYLLVGRMIVIVKRKHQNKLVSTNKDSSKTQTHMYASESVLKSHIYSSNLNLEALTWYERRTIYKTFKKELQWAQRRKAKPEEGKDSSDTEKKIPKVVDRAYNHFAEASVGIYKPLLSHKDNTTLNWESGMNFKQTSKTSLNADIGFGWVFEHLMLSTGLGYKQINTQTTWTEPRRRPIENINRSASETYDIVSIPFKAMAYKEWGNIFGAAGLGLKFNFVKLDFSYNNKFKRYYDDNSVASNYFQKANKLCLSSAFLLTGGMIFKKRYIFTVTGSYEPYWRPIENNSLYKLFPHQLSLNLGLIYQFEFKVK